MVDDLGSGESAQADPDDDEWLSTQAAAKRLGVTPRTLYRFVDQGDLPAYRMGRVIRLRAHEVDAFIESTRIQLGTLEHLRSEEHTSELQSLMRISYAVFCLTKQKTKTKERNK